MLSNFIEVVKYSDVFDRDDKNVPADIAFDAYVYSNFDRQLHCLKLAEDLVLELNLKADLSLILKQDLELYLIVTV